MSFNTTLVQLKVASLRSLLSSRMSQFQYHTGPIKREEALAVARVLRRFQYHTGPIKRMGREVDELKLAKVSIPHWSN